MQINPLVRLLTSWDSSNGINFGYVRKDYWRTKVNSHFIFYKIMKKEIQIIGILHKVMDIDSH